MANRSRKAIWRGNGLRSWIAATVSICWERGGRFSNTVKAALGLATCSLRPSPPTISLRVQLPARGSVADRAPAYSAMDCVAGFTIYNDWSARDLQRSEMAVGLGPSKGKDFANALGPHLVPFSELRDRYQNGRLNLNMSASINGRRVSQGNASSMYWSWPQLLAHASRDTKLLPGDVIGSGTVGTGCILELTPEVAGGWLKAGDVVQLEIERLGILENCVAVR